MVQSRKYLIPDLRQGRPHNSYLITSLSIPNS